MIIKATKKLLNISGIKAGKDTSATLETLPGEWYAAPISLLRPGKLAVQFLHYPTYILIVIPGKSLKKLVPLLAKKISDFLNRHGFAELESDFQLNSPTEIFSTNSRSMLAHMNQIKFDLEYHIAMSESIEEIDYNRLEDLNTDYMFGGKNKDSKYIRSIDVLKRLMEVKKMASS